MERNVSMGTGIAVVLNVVYFLIDLVVVGGEAIAKITAHSMAIAKPHPNPCSQSSWITVAVTLFSTIESKLIHCVISIRDVCINRF